MFGLLLESRMKCRAGRSRAILLLLSTATSVAGSDAREQIEAAKAATLQFACTNRKISGTATCVSRDGYFVTTYQTVRQVSADEAIRLVQDPTGKLPRNYAAEVIRSDQDLDLALLKVSAHEGAFTALPLGDDRDLFETLPVTALSFPGSKRYGPGVLNPTLRVVVGRISTLSKTAGKLDTIVLDVDVPPESAGGPLLNGQGQIIGIVDRVGPNRVYTALPVHKLRSFLAEPVVTSTPPRIRFDLRHVPTAWAVGVTEFVTPSPDLSVTLELRCQGHPDRSIKGQRQDDGRFKVAFTPIPQPTAEAERWTTGTIFFPAGELRAKILDRQVALNGTAVPLSALRLIRFNAEPLVRFADGSSQPIRAVLPKIKVDLGGYQMDVDLSQAQQLEISAPEEQRGPIAYRIVVRSGEREVARRIGVLRLEASSESDSEPVTEFTPYQGGLQTIELDDTIADAVLGGGGRLLMLRLKRSRRIAIYDVNQAKLVAHLELGKVERPVLAAGRDALFVFGQFPNNLTRWSLRTFEQTSNSLPPVPGSVIAAGMGYASRGPLLLAWSATGAPGSRIELEFIDSQRLDRLDVRNLTSPTFQTLQKPLRISASVTGSLFTVASPWGHGVDSIEQTGQAASLRPYHGATQHGIPTYDGRAILTDRSVATPDLQTHTRLQLPLLPTTHPAFFLALPSQARLQGQAEPGVYQLGKPKKLLELPELGLGVPPPAPVAPPIQRPPIQSGLVLSQRVFCVVQASQLITIPYSNDRLLIQPFDLRAALEQAEEPYFYLTSLPPGPYRPETIWQHQLHAVSSRGDVEFELSSGPQQMSLDPDGMLTWLVPSDFGERVTIAVQAKDSAGETINETYVLSP